MTTATSAPKEQLSKLVSSPPLQQILHALGEAELYIVGGTVREICAGSDPSDLDLACSLPPEESIPRFEAQGIKTVNTGLSHGTITVVLDSLTVEITTFRVPGDRTSQKYSKTISEDLAGRDFTINAIAFCSRTREFVDPFEGRKDLAQNILRTVGNPEDRFREDPLRVLRMYRFGHASGRLVEPHTKDAAEKLSPLLSQVAPERIGEEFRRMLVLPQAAEAVKAMQLGGVLETFIPEVKESVGFEQNEFHSEDVFSHTISVISQSEPVLLVRLAAFFHDLGKPHTLSVGEDGRRHFYLHEKISAEICQKVLKRLRMSKDITQNVSKLVAYHMRPLQCGPAAVRRLMRDLGELLDLWLLLKRADTTPIHCKKQLEADFEHFSALLTIERERNQGSPFGKLAVNGDDVIRCGVSEGKLVGEVLKTLEEEVLEDPDRNEREYLLQRIRQVLSEKQ